MNVLRFKKGYKNWETTYEVELDYEYSASFEKKITSLILYRPDMGRRVSIPWQAFEQLSQEGSSGAFVDSTGLKIRYANGGLDVSNGQNFNVRILPDQAAAIKRAARNVSQDVSCSVENILREYSSQRM
jgi:hypothetical protein